MHCRVWKKIRKREGEFGEIAQELSSRQERWFGSQEHSLLSQRTEVCFPALPLGASQLPLTLVPGNIMPCDPLGHTHDIHSHRHKKQIKSQSFRKSSTRWNRFKNEVKKVKRKEKENIFLVEAVYGLFQLDWLRRICPWHRERDCGTK